MIEMSRDYTVPSLAENNVSINSTDYLYVHIDDYSTIIQIEKYCLPLICMFGLIGNTLSTITFLRIPLRRAPCSLYLAARGISDNGFLTSLFMTWLSSTFQLRLSQVTGVCQTIVFMTYLCGCVSVWLCVFITFENFLLIQNPILYRRLSCEFIAKVCIAVLVFLATGFYNMSLWIINKDCSHNPEYTTLTQVLVYTDTVLTLLIPTIFIFMLLSIIAYKVINIMRIRRQNSSFVVKTSNGHQPTKAIKPIAKVTKMLFVVSFTFFALNVPSHAIRLHLLIGTFIKGYNQAPIVQRTIQFVFQLLYYLSFSVNIIVYALFGSNFRLTFVKTFLHRNQAMCSRFVQTEAVNLVPSRQQSLSRLEYVGTKQSLLTSEDIRSSP